MVYIILSLCIGFVIGWLVLRAIINLRVKRMLGSIANEPIPTKPNIKIVNLNFTKYNGRVYVYDRESHNFLAHGDTKQEILDSLQARFPNTSFMANTAELKEVGLD